MRRRLQVVFPDLGSARRVADDLLLARIEDRHMHFISRSDVPLAPLHEAGLLQKTDLRQAFFLGAGLGLLGGAGVGVYLTQNSLSGYQFGVGTLLMCLGLGMAFGAWASTLIGVSVPSSKLKPFEADLAAGRILLMVDVPVHRLGEIQRLLASRCPEAQDRGIDLLRPVFP